MTVATLALLFISASQTFNLPPGLLKGLCFVESHHVVEAINPADGRTASIGLCQLKYATAREMGYRGTARQLFDPHTNAFFAAKYLRFQLSRYHGNLHKAISAYNAGSYRRDKKGLTLNARYVHNVYIAWWSVE